MAGNLFVDRPKLRDLLEYLSDLPTYWEGDSRAYIAPPQAAPLAGAAGTTAGPNAAAGELRLSLRSSVGLGIDENRQEEVDSPDGSPVATRTTRSGLRTVILTCDVWSFNDFPSDEICEKIRFRIRRPSSSASLNAINMALIDIQPAIALDATADTKAIWRTKMDIRLGLVVNEVSDDDEGGIIRTVNTDNNVPGDLVN